MKRYEIRTPSCEVEFTVPRNRFDPDVEPDYETVTFRVRNEIQVCQTTKDINGNPGTFYISLPPLTDLPNELRGRKKTIYDAITPQSIVKIKFDEADWYMIGLVDRVAKHDSVIGDTLLRSVGIWGRDFSKLFIKHQIFYNPYVEENAEGILKGFLWNRGELVSGTPGEIISLMTGRLLNRIGMKTVDGKPIQELFDFENYVNKDTGEIKELLVNEINMQGSLWSFMRAHANLPWNELFVDTFADKGNQSSGGSRPRLVLRRTPFDEFDWANLRAREWERLNRVRDFGFSEDMQEGDIILHEKDIQSIHIGRSDSECFNYWWVQAERYLLERMEMHALSQPLIDYPSVQLFGLSKHWVDTSYLPNYEFDENGKPINENASFTNMADEIEHLRDRLRVWYKRNPNYESGYFRVRGNHLYHIGDPMRRPDAGNIRYYVERVQQNYNIGGKRTTILGVTRGFPV